MALFGAPQPIENSAQSAVSAAREMMGMVDMLNDERATMDEPILKVGFGIATGEVVAGYAGTESRAAYTCIGKTVNLAARLEAHTKQTGRTILFDEQTHNSLSDVAGCEQIQDAQFKGFSEMTKVFSLQG
jgi:class 3 adenylate cyclase